MLASVTYVRGVCVRPPTSLPFYLIDLDRAAKVRLAFFPGQCFPLEIRNEFLFLFGVYVNMYSTHELAFCAIM